MNNPEESLNAIYAHIRHVCDLWSAMKGNHNFIDANQAKKTKDAAESLVQHCEMLIKQCDFKLQRDGKSVCQKCGGYGAICSGPGEFTCPSCNGRGIV